MERIPRRLWGLSALVTLLFMFTGCQSGLFTALYLLKGTDVKPEFDILRKGEKRVVVVCRSLTSNSYEVQNTPRLIAAQVSNLLYQNVQNKKLKVVEPLKVETWLDDCNNDFDNFLEIGRDKSIEADIVIGIEIYGFRIRDPHSPYMVQGNCELSVKAYDCKTGEELASKKLAVVDPPNMPISGGPGLEAAFRPEFIKVVSQQVAMLFHDHDPHKKSRMDADNLELHRNY